MTRTLLLTRHVRERGDFTLERAVHELTGRQAEVFGFHGRGVVAPGNVADLAVFALDELHYDDDEFVHDLPGGGAAVAPSRGRLPGHVRRRRRRAAARHAHRLPPRTDARRQRLKPGAASGPYDPPMTYAFDPKLAEFAALTVNPPPTDGSPGEELSQQYLSVLGADVDTSTLDVDDRRDPGPGRRARRRSYASTCRGRAAGQCPASSTSTAADS